MPRSSNLCLLLVSLLSFFLHVVDSQPCSPTAVTTANTCCVGPLTIATTVTSIAARAYYDYPNDRGCATITSVSIPSTVTTIGLLLLLLLLLLFLLLYLIAVFYFKRL